MPIRLHSVHTVCAQLMLGATGACLLTIAAGGLLLYIKSNLACAMLF